MSAFAGVLPEKGACFVVFIMKITVVILAILVSGGLCYKINVNFEPKEIDHLRTYEIENITATFTIWPYAEKEVNLPIRIFCLNPDLCSVNPITTAVSFDIERDVFTTNLTVAGLFLGRTELAAAVTNGTKIDGESVTVSSSLMHVAVLRSQRGQRLSVIFTVVITIFVIVNTFLMGTQLDIDIILKVIKTPVGPIIGFVCQYGLMPLVSLLR